MEYSPYKQRIESQFDIYCKKVINNEYKDIIKHKEVRAQKETHISQLSIDEFNMLSYQDKYNGLKPKFEIHGIFLTVENEHLYKAIKSLSKIKQKIVLLSYLLDMTDKEISIYLNLVRRTVNYMRVSSLKELKKFMEEHNEEC